MRFILSALVVGFLFLWGLQNIPDFIGYIVVGTVIILLVRAINKK